MSKNAARSLYSFIRKNFPDGTSMRGIPVIIGGARLRIYVFSQQSGLWVHLGLFKWGKKYSRKTLSIHPSGAVVEEGPEIIVPQFDLSKAEPDFSKLSVDDIADLIAQQVIQ